MTAVAGRGEVETALGPVPLAELGPTLGHEHVFINLMRERRGDGLLHDEAAAVEELGHFARQGGRTIVDLTTAELTPGSVPDADPTFTATHPGQTREPASILALQRVSRATGVNVVLGTGRYRDPFIDRDLVDRLGVDGLAEEMVRDLEEGFPGTDARAGIIGEVGCDRWYISATEERVLRAAASASRQTGAAIYLHAARWPVGLAMLDLLEECGVDLRWVCVGHLDLVPDVEVAVEVARRGAFVGLDSMYSRQVGRGVVERVRRLAEHSALGQVILSQDVCVASMWRRNGGHGYGYVLGELRDDLAAAGIDAATFESMVTDNPARLLAGGHRPT